MTPYKLANSEIRRSIAKSVDRWWNEDRGKDTFEEFQTVAKNSVMEYIANVCGYTLYPVKSEEYKEKE